MKRNLLIIAFLAVAALAQTVVDSITVDVTDGQRKALRAVVRRMNDATYLAAVAANQPTNSLVLVQWKDYAVQLCTSKLNNVVRQEQDRGELGVREAYKAAAPAVQAQVDALLGITP